MPASAAANTEPAPSQPSPASIEPTDAEHQRNVPRDDYEDDYENVDDDDEWEEETKYIVLDVGSELAAADVQAAAAEHQGVSIIGLDSATPYLRIGDMIFQGAVDRTLGTDLIFATSAQDGTRAQRALRGPLPLSTDLNRPGIEMTYVGQSTLKAQFTRISLEKRPDPSAAEGTSTEATAPHARTVFGVADPVEEWDRRMAAVAAAAKAAVATRGGAAPAKQGVAEPRAQAQPETGPSSMSTRPAS
ncbi:hypothetical protein BDZ88DRAFT_139496 [Geranomyces variabilis]|nr:hypothetical protein BDZ88DRAFT_139496 [Geranomyces variabilis]KAJ3143522.1 hypothetical protein HDU90_000284 [Geranomyces variabilis]